MPRLNDLPAPISIGWYLLFFHNCNGKVTVTDTRTHESMVCDADAVGETLTLALDTFWGETF